MARLLVRYTYTAALADDRAARLAEHREWLAGLESEGRLLAAGAFTDGTGAVIVIEAPDTPRAVAAMDGDPFRVAELVADRSVEEWNVRWGPLA
jgi:uncharacterized protein YciI